jgi:hypothetical protein
VINVLCVRPVGWGYNVGNETIFVAIRRMLDDAFEGRANLISVPALGSGFAGLTRTSIHEMNQYGHGVVIGGGNLYENNELDVDLDALPRLQPPLMLFSLSRGRIYDRGLRFVDRTDTMPDRVISGLHERAMRSVARDVATRDHLRGLGLEPDLGGCPTLLLGRLDLPLPQLHPSLRGGALLSIRQPRLMNVPLRQQASVQDDVRRIAEMLRARYGTVRIVCHDLRDLTFASSLGDFELVYPGDALVHLAHLKAADVVVTYRLHAFLPAVSFGTPAVNLSYDERSQSLMRTVGLGDWDIDLVGSDDAVSDVVDRLDRLDDLVTIRREAQGLWDGLESVMREACRDFASRATAHASEGE